ncbi:antiviral reverse transcriptase Drt3a [Sphingobacterium daejeonense]|uniref:antiviral reverse transcriptase Drt3a n=1 Tax=Sphingobacterium daejeonense TaxID=371142 RepID=UPI0010C5B496|nr:antiviral reverse transcriptase Drt3a [Sphingobacterium daejeonense]VTP95828.1 Retron-type reverse transcriptase [Sphingobacterium daejeonense]
MLDQSFSFQNFRTIFEIENRKGGIVEGFFSDEYLTKSEEVSFKRLEMRSFIPTEEEDPILDELQLELENLLKQKESILENELFTISKEVNQANFNFCLNHFKGKNGKFIYTIQKSNASYFAMKQLQHNIYRSFKVKQSDRFQIVKQVKKLLQDNFEKYIVRTDIESFYESVPQASLMQVINGNQLLSPKSKKLIAGLLHNFNEISGQLTIPISDRKGVPRGVGISAYLAELYMRSIDNQIRQLPDLTFYGRYVDDIIAIFSPLKKMKPNTYLDKIEFIVNQEGLKVNKVGIPIKTYEIDAFTSNKENSIEFLGYCFKLNGKNYEGIYLSSNKIKKYTTRLTATFDSFIKDSTYNYKSAKKLLIHRLNFLTKNTHLQRPKKGIIGIYYSNSLLENDSSCLNLLNKIMHDLIDNKLPLSIYANLNPKLKRFCFRKGFVDKQFFHISSKRTTARGTRGKNIPDTRSTIMRLKRPTVNNFEKIVLAWK